MHSEGDSSCVNGNQGLFRPPSPASAGTAEAAVVETECSQCSASPLPRGRSPGEASGRALAAARSQLARLRASNDALRRNIAALRMLAAEADRVTTVLGALPPPRAPPQLPPAADGAPAIAGRLLELAFSEDYESNAALEQQYVNLPAEVMVALESAFRQRLADLVGRWTSEVASRPSLERRLASAMRSRINGTRVLSQKCPDVQAKLVSAMMPAPGSPAAAAARARLADVAADLGVDDRQRGSLRHALAEFRGAVDSLRQAVDLAQLTAAVCLTAGENAEDAAYRMLSLHLVAHNSVALTSTADVFQQLQRRTLYAYLRLAAAVFGALSAVQGAKLLLGSLPYLPDHAELCVIVCGEE